MGISAQSDTVRLHLLGQFRVLVHSHVIDNASWRLQKVRALIKILALEPGHRLHREHVVSILWPELDSRLAFNNLHQALYIARRVFALSPSAEPNGAYLDLRNQMLTLSPSVPVWVDVEEFEAAAAVALASSNVEACERALACYMGDLLPDDRYEDWTRDRRQALYQNYLSLLVRAASLYARSGASARAIEALKEIVRREPAHEEAQAELMRLYAQIGERHAARQQYLRLEAALRDLDAAPMATTTRLLQEIETGRVVVELDVASTRGGRRPTLSEPHPRRTAVGGRNGGVTRGDNLPVPIAGLVGRQRDLEALQRLLGSSRLLVLTGPGGSGKTRLALELARKVSGTYQNGAWWVDLQALSDPTLIPSMIASTIGLREEAGRPLDATLVEDLRDRECLLVLDNCEHLLPGCASLTQTLLNGCRHVHVIVTSRERLGVVGEARWAVTPLAVPSREPNMSVEEVAGFEAVALFVARGRAMSAGFQVTSENAGAVAEICRRLDGLPLAIEMAAARTHALSLGQILDTLGSRLLSMTGSGPNRYGTLGEAIDWSYRLLDPQERTLLNRLSVFAGTVALEAAQVICADAVLRETEILDAIADLVDKSMVVAEETSNGTFRYRLLETIREFARGRLREAGEEREFLRRHWTWYQEQVDEGYRRHGSWDAHPWFETLEPEHDNLRAALDEATAAGAADVALTLSVGLAPFWQSRGYWTEGRKRLERVLAGFPNAAPSVRVAAMYWQSDLARHQGDFDSSRALLDDCLSIYQALGDHAGTINALCSLGWIARRRKDLRVALDHLTNALSMSRAAGLAQEVVRSLLGLSSIHKHLGDHDVARRHAEDGLRMARESGDERSIAEFLSLLGELAEDQGDLVRARALVEDYLRMSQGQDLKVSVAYSCQSIGRIAAKQGENRVVVEEWLNQALRLFRELGDRRRVPQTLCHLVWVAYRAGDYVVARAHLEEALSAFRRLDDQSGVGSAVAGFAALAVAGRHLTRAARLFGAAASLERLTGTLCPLGGWRDYDTERNLVQEALGDRRFAAANAEGAGMSMDEAAAYALHADWTMQASEAFHEGQTSRMRV